MDNDALRHREATTSRDAMSPGEATTPAQAVTPGETMTTGETISAGETMVQGGTVAEGPSAFRLARDGYAWDGVVSMQYKQDGSAPFKDISRQVLFDDPALQCQLRYFEMRDGGYSTLERHEHAHAVMILRGHGQCLVGLEIRDLGPHDLVTIPAWTWHQFRANAGEAFGFLCMVNHERDRPALPTEGDVADLCRDDRIRAFLGR